MDEGYIKYKSIFTQEPITISESLLSEINDIRHELVALNMIGKIPNGPGFGNISVRQRHNEFVISGTDTGHLSQLTTDDISWVSQIDIEANCVWNKGNIQASSESMSHGVIYISKPPANAIIHIHHKQLWRCFIDKLPTTSKYVAYGTPEMAKEIQKVLDSHDTDHIIVLGGHTDGLIAFGHDLKEAFDHILKLFKKIG